MPGVLQLGRTALHVFQPVHSDILALQSMSMYFEA